MSKGRRGRERRKTRKKRVNEGSPYGQPGSLATRESLRDGVENTSELLKGKETGTNLSISSFQWSGLLVGHSLSASHLPCVVTEHTGQEPEHCQLERCRKPPIDKGTSMLVSSWGRGGCQGTMNRACSQMLQALRGRMMTDVIESPFPLYSQCDLDTWPKISEPHSRECGI